MVEFLLTFSRVVVAFLSGALLIVGTTYLADLLVGAGSAFDQVAEMLKNEFQSIFLVIAGLSAYAIGLINVAGSSVALRRLADATDTDLVLVSRFEGLQQPYVLKEALELLQLKRALVAFAFPLFYFGLALACDFKEHSFSNAARIMAGLSVAVLGGLAPVLAARISRLLAATAKQLVAEAPKRK